MDIAPGEVRALLGKNGAGKSTLIRLLTGAEIPDAGEVLIGGQRLEGRAGDRTRRAVELGIRAVYQELSLVPDMDIAENMFLGTWPAAGGMIDHRRIYEEAGHVLETLGFPIEPASLVSTLSPAKRQLVEIARAMMGDPRLVILDEPTSSLAADEVDLVFEAVRRAAARGVSVLYVSHRMREIRAIAAAATIMRDGRIIDTVAIGDVGTDEIVAMMLGKEAVAQQVPRAREAGAVTLSVRDIRLAPKLVSVSFSLNAGEVLGIAGLLGSGRTELLRVIAGIDAPDSGTVEFAGRPIDGMSYAARIAAGIALTPENRKDDGIFPLLGVDENVVIGDWRKVADRGIIWARRVRDAFASISRRMSIKAARQDAPISTLSGGNQQKVVIGRWIHAGASVLLLDEPTRGVDVEAKAQIYAIVRDISREGAAVIFVSSEIEELPLVCDRVLVLRHGRMAEAFTSPDIDSDALLAASIT